MRLRCHTFRTSRKSSVWRVSTAQLTVPWLGRVADEWANAVKLETVSVTNSGSGSESVSLVDMEKANVKLVAACVSADTDQSSTTLCLLSAKRQHSATLGSSLRSSESNTGGDHSPFIDFRYEVISVLHSRRPLFRENMDSNTSLESAVCVVC